MVLVQGPDPLRMTRWSSSDRRTNHIIVGSEKDALCEGSIVTVNWQRKKVQAKILALSGKFNFCAFCLERDHSEI